MENMDKVLTALKWVPKIHQMPQNLSAQFVCLRPKVLNFKKKSVLGLNLILSLNLLSLWTLVQGL